MCSRFNSRPHEEVDSTLVAAVSYGLMFQLTTSRRGRQNIKRHGLYKFLVSTHDLTKRSTEGRSETKRLDGCFNSRPHEEVDPTVQHIMHLLTVVSTHDLTKRSTPYSLICSAIICSFNSRPHEEVDISPYFNHSFFTFVFQLTTSRRGRPIQYGTFHAPLAVSTHDLTKRSTSVASFS